MQGSVATRCEQSWHTSVGGVSRTIFNFNVSLGALCRSTFPSSFTPSRDTQSAPPQAFSDISKPELRLILQNTLSDELKLRSFSMGDSTLTPSSRRIVLGWMIEVCGELSLSPATLFLSASILDRFTAMCPTMQPNTLQLAATVCYQLAAKFLETRNISVEECVCMADNTICARDLPVMELSILETLDWSTHAPTSYTFLQLLLQGLPSLPHATQALTSFLVELSLLDADMLAFSHCTTAAAALLLASATLNSGCSSGGIRAGIADILPGAAMDSTTLSACMSRLCKLQAQACFGGEDMTCQPILDKYRRSEVVIALVCPGSVIEKCAVVQRTGFLVHQTSTSELSPATPQSSRSFATAC